MVGRAAIIRGRQCVLCPVCCRIHEFTRRLNAWVSECCEENNNADREKEKNGKRRKKGQRCPVCDESGQSPPLERVDHLSGKMHQLWFCVRHYPPKGVLERCVNMRQITAGWIDTLHPSTRRR